MPIDVRFTARLPWPMAIPIGKKKFARPSPVSGSPTPARAGSTRPPTATGRADKFFSQTMSRRSRRRLPAEPVRVEITDLSHDGRGVGRVDEKAVFVHGALPGETVQARLIARNRRYDEALCVEVIEPSSDRV